VLEEYSNFPERLPETEYTIDTIRPKCAQSGTDSEDDVVCMKRADVSEPENVSETENSVADTRSATVGNRKNSTKHSENTDSNSVEDEICRKQERAEHVFRGKTTVLSVAEVNKIKCRIPKDGKLVEILGITEIVLAGGIKRFKISYERCKTDEASADDHYSFILQSNNIVKQVRSVHQIVQVGEKAGVAFSGMVLVEPQKPGQTMPFQMLYIWKPNATGSDLYLLDIEGLTFVVRPYRLGPFRHCHLEGTDDHVCALLFDASQVSKSELSAPIKHALLQIISNQWQSQEKGKCQSELVKQVPKKEKKKKKIHINVSKINPPAGVLDKLLSKSKTVERIEGKKDTRGVLKQLLRKRTGALLHHSVSTRNIFTERLEGGDTAKLFYLNSAANDSSASKDFETVGMVSAAWAADVGRSDVGGCNAATVTGQNMNTSCAQKSQVISNVVSGAEAQKVFGSENSVSSEPRAEIQFTGVKTDDCVRNGSHHEKVSSSPTKAEIAFTRIKNEAIGIESEPLAEVALEAMNSANEPRAEIEFTCVKSEPPDTEMESSEVETMETEEEPIAPLSEDQVKIIMEMKANRGEKEQNIKNMNTSSKTSASTIMKATKSLSDLHVISSHNVAKTIVQQPRSPRHVPNILKSSAVSQLQLSEVAQSLSAEQRPTVTTRATIVPSRIEVQYPKKIHQVVPHVLGYLEFGKPKKGEPGYVPRKRVPRKKFYPTGGPRFKRKVQGKHPGLPRIVSVRSENLSQYSGDALWDKIVEKTASSTIVSSSPSVDSSPKTTGEYLPKVLDVYSENPDDRWHKVVQKSSSESCPVTGSDSSKKSIQTVPKILEVHSENLSAYSGDALWDKIVEKSSSSMTTSALAAVNSGPKILKVQTDKPWKNPEDNWDSIFRKNSAVSVSSEVKVEPVEAASAVKVEQLDNDIAGNNYDSDSDHDGVLLRAGDVPADDDDPTNSINIDNNDNHCDSLNSLNQSFGGFGNVEPITIHIPLDLPKQKKFFKSTRDVKSKFDKGKFISSAIRKGASKYEFVEQPLPEVKRKYKRGQRINPNPAHRNTWRRLEDVQGARTYSCSLPQGGEVIRRVGIIKEIKPPTAPSKYACDICGHSFKYSADLRMHFKIHTEFHCDICNVDMPTKKIYSNHIDTFHAYLSNHKSSENDKPKLNCDSRYDNLDRYFSYVEAEDKDKKDNDLEWEKCYKDNGLVSLQLKSEPMELSTGNFDDGKSVHSSDSDVQDGDVFAPLHVCGDMSGPSEAEWAKIIAK
jgi:hypothetical protein